MARRDIQAAIKEFSGLSAEQTKRKILAQQNGGTGEFKEEDHPRDKDGKFTNKGGGSSGGSHKGGEAKEDTNTADNGYYSDKRKIQSEVFYKISTVRKRLEKKGEAIITVYDSLHEYIVRLYGSDRDYEYDIIKRNKI